VRLLLLLELLLLPRDAASGMISQPWPTPTINIAIITPLTYDQAQNPHKYASPCICLGLQ
jgi:hypothetical protein